MSNESTSTEETTIETETTTPSIEDKFYTSETPNEDSEETTDEKTTDSEEEVATSEEETEEADSEETKEDQPEGTDYKLELSKDSSLKDDDLKEIEAFAKEHKLSEEAAKTLLGKQDSIVSKFVESQKTLVQETLGQWRDAVINDPLLGGDNLLETSENAKRATQAYGNDKFVDMLRDSGYGDHPEVVRFLSKIGTNLKDDTLVMPGSKATVKTIEERFYGNNN